MHPPFPSLPRRLTFSESMQDWFLYSFKAHGTALVYGNTYSALQAFTATALCKVAHNSPTSLRTHSLSERFAHLPGSQTSLTLLHHSSEAFLPLSFTVDITLTITSPKAYVAFCSVIPDLWFCRARQAWGISIRVFNLWFRVYTLTFNGIWTSLELNSTWWSGELCHTTVGNRSSLRNTQLHGFQFVFRGCNNLKPMLTEISY